MNRSAITNLMPDISPGRSLFRLLVLPVVGLLIAAVIANVGCAVFLAARRAHDSARAQQKQVARALEKSRVALSRPVLETLKLLTGSEFLIWNAPEGIAGLSTLSADILAHHAPSMIAAAEGTTVTLANARYHVGTARSGSVRSETVLVLTPVRSAMLITLEAIWPVLAVAAATLAVLVPLGLVATARLARRIVAVEKHVARIAAGHFGEQLADATTDHQASRDDIGRLVAGVNHLSGALATLRKNLVAGERQRLLGQLAAGFAHELRNAVTGARLAIDLHRRRCTTESPSDSSLDVATRQLDILAEEVRGLLELGRPGEVAAGPVDIPSLVADVCDLTGPRAEHAGVVVTTKVAENLPPLAGRREAIRAALVNLALNAIDAAGRDGHVWVHAAFGGGVLELVVEDNGPGPPAALADSLAEPFVTGKREGIGLGLAVARAVAEDHGGALSWSRQDACTRFTMRLPTSQPRDPLHGHES